MVNDSSESNQGEKIARRGFLKNLVSGALAAPYLAPIVTYGPVLGAMAGSKVGKNIGESVDPKITKAAARESAVNAGDMVKTSETPDAKPHSSQVSASGKVGEISGAVVGAAGVLAGTAVIYSALGKTEGVARERGNERLAKIRAENEGYRKSITEPSQKYR